MSVIVKKVNINRSVADIFRFMADFSNNPHWQPESIQLQRSGKVRVGDMVVGMQRVLGQMRHVNADVIDYSPNQRITYKGVMGNYNFSTTYDFTFSGGTGSEISITTDIRIPWWHFLFRPFVLRSLDSQWETAIANLKTYLEGRRDLGSS